MYGQVRRVFARERALPPSPKIRAGRAVPPVEV
jgi:hypothetical protein